MKSVYAVALTLAFSISAFGAGSRTNPHLKPANPVNPPSAIDSVKNCGKVAAVTVDQGNNTFSFFLYGDGISGHSENYQIAMAGSLANEMVEITMRANQDHNDGKTHEICVLGSNYKDAVGTLVSQITD